MRFLLCLGGAALAVAGLAAQSGSDNLVWAPKKKEIPPYTAPMKPHTVLKDVLAKHRADPNWKEWVVRDGTLDVAYVSMGPGQKTPPRFHPDTREWWVVLDGQIRFAIEGQQPFVAAKGWMVQVPYRLVYSMETVGDKPSVRVEANIANAKTLYPTSVTPPPMPGFEWLQVRMTQPKGVYDHGNKPYVVYDQIAADIETKNPKTKSGQYRFIQDDRAVSNFIYGYESSLPPDDPKNRGHYHPECGEMWLIMGGQISYRIEGVQPFVADTGDIVYTTPFRFHVPRFHGSAAACRLAMNGYPEISHLFDTPQAHEEEHIE